MAIHHLNPSTTLIYSEILDMVKLSPPVKSEGLSFSPKTRNGIKYWYIQQTMGSAYRKQVFIGREDEGALELIRLKREEWENAKADLRELEKLSSMAISGGCFAIDQQAYKVLSMLEQSGVFSQGCVLVGSYAFQSYSNMLGVSWLSDTAMTQDLDLAANDDCLIAAPSSNISLSDQLIASDKNMLRVGALDHKQPSTSYKIRGKQVRVDVITSVKPNLPNPTAPVHIPSLDTYAHALRFLDFILEDSQQAVLLGKSPILVNVPSPGRFALHKLVISTRRPASDHLKSKKDVAQASQLIEVLLSERPGDIWMAMDAANQYPSEKFKNP